MVDFSKTGELSHCCLWPNGIPARESNVREQARQPFVSRQPSNLLKGLNLPSVQKSRVPVLGAVFSTAAFHDGTERRKPQQIEGERANNNQIETAEQLIEVGSALASPLQDEEMPDALPTSTSASDCTNGPAASTLPLQDEEMADIPSPSVNLPPSEEEQKINKAYETLTNLRKLMKSGTAANLKEAAYSLKLRKEQYQACIPYFTGKKYSPAGHKLREELKAMKGLG